MGLLIEGWLYRQAIPIRPTQSALTGFTAILTDAMLPAAVTEILFDATEGALASGGDLRISVDEDGEIIVGLDALRRWDKAASKMEIAYFVPSTSAALTTTLYLWWGKDNATQPAANELGGQYAAYDNDTIFCAPVGGGANRTAFSITGTDVGGIIAGDTAAPSGLLGTKHTDVGDYSTYGDNPDLDLINTDWTISFLFRATTSGLEQYVLGKYDHTTQNRGYLCMFSGSQHFDLTYQPVPTSYDPIYRLSSGVDVVDGQWHHLAGTFISGTRASVYTDGILRNTTTNNIPSSVASNNASFQIGTQVTAQNRPADFSHVTVHSVARSAEWLRAENDNFRDPNSFYGTFSAPTYLSASEIIDSSYDLALAISTILAESRDYDLALAISTILAESRDYDLALAISTILAESRDYDLALYIDVTQDEVVDNRYDLALALSTILAESRDYDLALLIREPAEGGSSSKFRSSAIKQSIVQQISRNIA